MLQLRAGSELPSPTPVDPFSQGAKGQGNDRSRHLGEAVISAEGRYRFKKRDFTRRGGRVYYLKAVAKKRWADKRFRSGPLLSMTMPRTELPIGAWRTKRVTVRSGRAAPERLHVPAVVSHNSCP